ncbi:cation:proton antiporter [[Eubacterium] cellulosolvens]
MDQFLLIFFFLVLVLGLISKRIERFVITAPIVLTIAGLLVFFAFPVLAEVEVKSNEIMMLSSIALALILFTDASRINIFKIASSINLSARMLTIGMPLTIILGTGIALMLFTGLTLWEAAILAVILSPTDAGLGHAVVSNKHVPMRIHQALNIEAGLNDGISLPFLFLFIALARVGAPQEEFHWILETVQQIGFGLVIGIVSGYLGGRLIGKADRRGWIREPFHQIIAFSLAIMCWGFAEYLHVNSFLAVFVCGLLIKKGYDSADEKMVKSVSEKMLAFSEAWGQMLSFAVFFVFGVIIFKELIGLGTPVIWLYAILSLTLIRMLPVAVSLIGTHLKPTSILFLGWFGPRGLASIVLGLIFIGQKYVIPGKPIIESVVTVTVFLSIFAHGITSAPAVKYYSRFVKKLSPDAPELKETVERPVRRL